MPGSIQMTPASPALNRTCRPFSFESCLEHRQQLLLELLLQFLLQFVQFGLRVLLEPLSLDAAAVRSPSRAAHARRRS